MMKRLFLALFLLVGGPSVCLGEDIAIFGVEAPSTVKPNVLIIFDNSGSMDTDDVESNPYDPTQTYPGTYDSDRVYQMYIGAGRQIFWNNFASSTSIISCTPVREKLEDIGFETARIGYYSCGGMRRVLKTGNYLNYEATGSSVVDTRLNVAKAAVTEILTNTTDAYFGLMVFNYDPSLSPSQSEGGRLVVECGSTSTTQSDGTETIDNTAIINEVQGISAETWTPLAETLAEAGTYFAGGSSLFNTGVTYTSPITNYCQKNYVIIITDGEPKADHAPILYDPDTPYLNGKSISEYAGDTSDEPAVTEPGSDNTASYYLDDVAALLKTEDLLPLMGDASTIETQNLVTFTIGFKTNQPLLQKTAERGGGLYYTANTASSLAAALDQIVRTIKEDATSFVAPVIPVNRANPTRSGGFIYLAFFKPKQNQEWIGNIKKYKLSENGSIYDANNTLATNPDHSLKESSLSFWTQTVPHDGGTIEAGGIGERIVAQTSRNLYTYQGSQSNLTHSSNRLAENNSISFNSQPIANQAIARAANGHNGWKVGAIIHSEPLVAHYSATQTAIFFGANDGFLHAIDDATGEELWAFVPPDQLPRLSLLSNSQLDYYVDGSPSITVAPATLTSNFRAPKTLMIGERRGGTSYYALDISTLATPRWKYKISKSIIQSTLGETLGQSWGTPKVATAMVSATEKKELFFLPGGYDPQQDSTSPATTDTVGRALFSVVADTGALGSFRVAHKAAATPQPPNTMPSMTHCFVDINVVDHDADGIATRIFAGDMGGNIFGFADDTFVETLADSSKVIRSKAADGTWSYKEKLFSDTGKKFFHAPSLANIGGDPTLFFGSGNRENPMDEGLTTPEQNRVYALKVKWASTGLTPANLVDATSSTASITNGSNGWYVTLPNPGEKVVSPVIIDSGNLYFTTYTPPADQTNANPDPCTTNATKGKGRLYIMNARNGAALLSTGRSLPLLEGLPMATPVIKDRKIRVGSMAFDLHDSDTTFPISWKKVR